MAASTPVDMNESFTKEFLSCSICWEMYDDKARQPKLLSCHHTFCKGCLKKLQRGRSVIQVTTLPASTIIRSATSLYLPTTCLPSFSHTPLSYRPSHASFNPALSHSFFNPILSHFPQSDPLKPPLIRPSRCPFSPALSHCPFLICHQQY